MMYAYLQPSVPPASALSRTILKETLLAESTSWIIPSCLGFDPKRGTEPVSALYVRWRQLRLTQRFLRRNSNVAGLVLKTTLRINVIRIHQRSSSVAGVCLSYNVGKSIDVQWTLVILTFSISQTCHQNREK